MKILTAMYTMRRGGAYDRFLMMLEAFLERNCEIHCLSLTPIQIRSPFFNNHVIRLPFHLNNHTLTRISVLILFPFYTLFIGWREKVDLIIAFGPIYAFLQSVAKWMLRKPMVTLIRFELSLDFKRHNIRHDFIFLNKVIEYIGLIFSDRIITVNSAIREEIIKTIGRWKIIEVEVLFNNVPEIKESTPEEVLHIREQFGIPKGSKILVTAGVLTPRKNIETLLISLSKLRREDLFLLIVGDPSTQAGFHYQSYLRKLVRELDLGERVIFTGWVGKEDLWKIYLASDLFLLPSLNEGMPNAMLEALGFGLPCLGSRISGVKDILQYEELMFDPEDEKDILEKISRFFSDGQHSNHIIELCRGRKKEFLFDWKEKVFQMATKGVSSSRWI